MKVYVVVPDYSYEGYGEPEAAYSTRELAEAARVELRKTYSAPREIVELDIDEPNSH